MTQGGIVGRGRVLALFTCVAAVVLVIDQVTKHVAVAQLEHDTPVRLFGGAVYLTLVRNSGAAFSLGTDYTAIFPMITLGVVCWLGWMARKVRSLPWAIGLGLLLGGALGNLGDRVFRSPGFPVGHVVDMVSVLDDGGHVFPVFNAADSALFVGVVLLVLLELTGRRRDGTRAGTEKIEESADIRG